ncbi:MAG: Sua5/YciO/YrdC/YwlC family protein, partial [Planctomycetia bacterium]|nr:Sua5/YciO/YrdC/YwlC family protein [Planctomycetia bacterium]
MKEEKMAARVIHLQERGFDIKLVNEAVSALRNGALVVLPTETVYGIAVRADDQTAVKHLM